jgi:hypothetical protein
MGAKVVTFEIDEKVSPQSVSVVEAGSREEAQEAVAKEHQELEQIFLGRPAGRLWAFLNVQPDVHEVTTAGGERGEDPR